MLWRGSCFGVAENVLDVGKDIPDALQMHWANLHNMFLFLALEDTVSSASGHTCYVQ